MDIGIIGLPQSGKTTVFNALSRGHADTAARGSEPNVGVVKGGAQLIRDIRAQYIDNGKLTLVLDDSIASWPMANNLASLINGYMSPDGPNVAKAVDQKNVEVTVSADDQKDPATFISQILQAYVHPSQISGGARVVVNAKTGTVIVSVSGDNNVWGTHMAGKVCVALPKES